MRVWRRLSMLFQRKTTCDVDLQKRQAQRDLACMVREVDQLEQRRTLRRLEAETDAITRGRHKHVD